MRAEKFERNDIGEVNSWYRARSLAEVPEKSFPENGFIVRGVAAVFIYLTDSDIALLEGLITNPDSGRAGKVIKPLIETAYRRARELRNRVVVIVRTPSVKNLVLSLGYKNLGAFDLFIRS